MNVKVISTEFEATFNVTQLKAVDESYDGLSFSLVNGIIISHSDINMPVETKKAISNACRMNVPDATLNVNLNSYSQPISITK